LLASWKVSEGFEMAAFTDWRQWVYFPGYCNIMTHLHKLSTAFNFFELNSTIHKQVLIYVTLSEFN
jgi:hypothetical protein